MDKVVVAVEKICEAQTFLRKKLGQVQYGISVKKMLDRTNSNVDILLFIARDNENQAMLRLLAVAAMGE